MSEHVIRDLMPSDLPEAVAINNANVPAVNLADEPMLANLLAQSVVALGAEPAGGGPLAGFCLVIGPDADYGSQNYRWFNEHYDDFMYLDRVAVADWARNGGIGTAMYAEVERRATSKLFALEVNLRPRNDGSLRFHHRLGFEEVGQQETDYGVLVSLLAKPLL